MPSTRKKVIKTVYKDDDSEEEGGDFSDSGSDAKFSAEETSSDEEVDCAPSSGDEFNEKSNVRVSKSTKLKTHVRKPKLTSTLLKKITKQVPSANEDEYTDVTPSQFSVKDLTEADKLLPSILNLSESDSSDDEDPRTKKTTSPSFWPSEPDKDICSDGDVNMEYKDVWSNNIQDDSEEIAKKTFMELEKHKSKIEETKASLQNYTLKVNSEKESDVKDLLAMGEEVLPEAPETVPMKKKSHTRRKKDDSDSEMEDWEEVKESKGISQQGIQLFVEFPEAGCRKSKKVDVEMMMKRKINRVKKEYQVYMHKVHVLCWIGHGNFVSRVLNDQELMAAVLSLVPSKECYPGDRVDMKYVEQITTWYKDKLTLKQDKNEDKFKPKAPPLKTILLEQIKNKVVTTRKYLVFIFVTMLRALGLQCRIMFNFVTLPIKPPSSELCSLAVKPKEEKVNTNDTSKSPTNTKDKKDEKGKQKAGPSNTKTRKQKITQVDGCDDRHINSDEVNIMQVDGNDDTISTRKTRSGKRTKAINAEKSETEDVSPPKIAKKRSGRASPKATNKDENKNVDNTKLSHSNKNTKDTVKEKVNAYATVKEQGKNLTRGQKLKVENSNDLSKTVNSPDKIIAAQTEKRTRTQRNSKNVSNINIEKEIIVPKISVTNENAEAIASKYFEETKPSVKNSRLSRKRSQTANPDAAKSMGNDVEEKVVQLKTRTKSVPGTASDKSKYFENDKSKQTKRSVRRIKEEFKAEDSQRVSHRDLPKAKKAKGDVTEDLVNIIKSRIKVAKEESKKGIVKDKIKKESDEDSDYLPVEDPKRRNSESDEDFKPTKISPKPSKISPKPTTSRRIDRRVLSSVSSEEPKKNKIDVWCEIFVEELEQWISVDVIKGKVHSSADLYNNATHPVCYVVGWDNNNYLKDLTRKYVPHWNTVTRKLRAEPPWWDKAVQPWLGPKTARDKEEDEYLDRMQLEAPLPKSIAEYKNHPLYALKRHLLKFEALYPPDAAVLGFVRNEPVYARECVYVCRSRDTWLKEAKVVKLGEKPYKIVKARPKWDKLSNKLITDKPLEVFGPWQVQDYEPPTAENGIVPRNAYGNVELFKDCMLPKGTVHIKLPGLNRVAKKLNIDCAPAMTGFDFNGGWSHPVYDGFVVCKEFEEVITEAWVKDQEEQERKELEKIEARVYGNWKRLIKGLLIRERLKCKYGFEEPSTSENTKKSKGPRLVVKKKS